MFGVAAAPWGGEGKSEESQAGGGRLGRAQVAYGECWRT